MKIFFGSRPAAAAFALTSPTRRSTAASTGRRGKRIRRCALRLLRWLARFHVGMEQHRFRPFQSSRRHQEGGDERHPFVRRESRWRRPDWTIKDLAQWGGVGGVGPVFVGSPATVADILQEWVEETDVDGFNLAYAVTHETFEDIVNLLVPELQRRGAYPTAYGPGSTLRERLFSAGPYLPENHPAAQYRDIEAFKRKRAERRAAPEEQVNVAQEVTA